MAVYELLTVYLLWSWHCQNKVFPKHVRSMQYQFRAGVGN